MMSHSDIDQDVATNGWAAVPRSFSKGLLDVDQKSPAKISVDDVKLPNSDLVRRTFEYAKKELPENTFNHSMRVYYYGEFALLLSLCSEQALQLADISRS
jgi:cyanamide hydratase